MILAGKCVCPGIAEGRAHVVDSGGWLAAALARETVLDPQAEFERFEAGRLRAGRELERLRNLLAQRGQAHDAGIFAAQATILDDRNLLERVEEEIRANLQSAESAVARVAIEIHNSLRESELPAIRDKAADVFDVGQRLVQSRGETAPLETPTAGVIVASSVVPSDLVHYVHHGAVAVVTETCGSKSHTAILARGLGIPMVTGIEAAVRKIRDQASVLIDAGAGLVVVDPGTAEEETVRRIRASRTPLHVSSLPAVPRATRDGVKVDVLLNISDPIEAENLGEDGVAGVGLFRTEFLYMDRITWPTEDESFQAYHRVSRSVGSRELNIRLADFGAEKCPAYADIPVNRNPSLGIRGVRLLLARPDILEPQVRALARLAASRPVTVLLPMIDTLDTLQRARAAIERACGVSPGGALPFRLGTMIEIPAAAMAVDDLIHEVDSLAVGLNDLTQYLLAADRDDEFVESYHDALQPPVLRLLHRVTQAADGCGKPVTMCGELAGESSLTALLLALGVRRFSVSRSHVGRIGAALRDLSVSEGAALAPAVLVCKSGREIRRLLQSRGILPAV
jgi:phosphoenolpyruvate-protein phosphotransferase